MEVNPFGALVPYAFYLARFKKKKKNCSLLLRFNDQVEDSLTSVTYTSFEDALIKLRQLGKGPHLAKADFKSAFPFLPLCFNSLGIFSAGNFYFDKYLPIGCSLSYFYFKSFSSFLKWVIFIESGSLLLFIR